jgi:general secretion pathway protein A
MYEAYWQLDARPFEHPLDPRFCFAAETQRGALLKLRYVIEHRRGAAVLAGETGLGKTLVAQTLLSELPPAFAPRVHLVFPQMPVPLPPSNSRFAGWSGRWATTRPRAGTP